MRASKCTGYFLCDFRLNFHLDILAITALKKVPEIKEPERCL
jgi:hypothetical protein